MRTTTQVRDLPPKSHVVPANSGVLSDATGPWKPSRFSRDARVAVLTAVAIGASKWVDPPRSARKALIRIVRNKESGRFFKLVFERPVMVSNAAFT